MNLKFRIFPVILIAFIITLIVAFPAAYVAETQPAYDEPYRPQFHFTPIRNWMNDPNGLVYYNGDYFTSIILTEGQFDGTIFVNDNQPEKVLWIEHGKDFYASLSWNHLPRRRVWLAWMDRFNGVATKYVQHYLAWFRYLDSKEYENTASNKKNMLVKSCLFSKVNMTYPKTKFHILLYCDLSLLS